MYFFILNDLFFLLINSGCQTTQIRVSSVDEAESNLTQKDAEYRAKVIRDIKYQLSIGLEAGQDEFKGQALAEFTVDNIKKPLFIDFKNSAKLEKLILNGKALETKYSMHRLVLPVDYLIKGLNRLEAVYVRQFSRDGRGLHRFQDPEDKRDYLYTQFETNDAHHMFPCFDQPDLKATLTMTVTAPKDWEVITTMRETAVQRTLTNVVWIFPETLKLSTYLFSLHAGPYKVWQADADGVPLRLFARRTIAKYVNTKDWFVPTQQGFKYFNEYFALPYPFKKYDQVIAPDFNAGAMENVAAVTFSERYIQRGASTREQREAIASVILHEMAHMWFGNITTMKWWNGLWLNESFATFMSALSQAYATEFKESWMSFYHDEQQSALVADQLVTTHPIEAVIPDTNSAFANFDDITYGKGASALKQLNYYLGEDIFRKGVREYFKTHAYSNTTLQDFIDALQKASGKDLKSWADTWLRQQGIDSVTPEFSCENGRVSRFALKLVGPDGQPSPRVHRTLVTFLKSEGAQLVPQKSVSVVYQGAVTEVKEFKGEACPAWVDPNDEAHDYAKVKFDDRTLAAAKEKLSAVSSGFARLRASTVLFQMVRDLDLSPEDYLAITKTAISVEPDLQTLGTLLEPLDTVFNYITVNTEAERKIRASLISEIEKSLWTRLQKSAAGSDWQKLLIEHFVKTAESKDAADKMVALLNKKILLKGFDLDSDRRWALIIRLSALGDARLAPLLEAQKKADPSDRGLQMASAADAATPSLEVKRKWFNELTGPETKKYSLLRTSMRWAFSPWQDSLKEAFAKDYFDTLPLMAREKQVDRVELFARVYAPTTCTASSVAALGSFLKTHQDLPPVVYKELQVAHQEDGKCVAARAK
jgi:aminopeptidase N